MLPPASALRPNFSLLSSLFLLRRRLTEAKIWRKLDTDPQHGQYYEHCSRSIVPGEAAMSAPPFFQSAGRGDLLFWGEKEGPTVVIWESYQNKKITVVWMKQAQCTTGSCSISQNKGRGNPEIRSCKLNGKEIFFDCEETKLKEEKNKRLKAKRMHITGRAYDTGHGGSKATSK